VKKLSKDKQKKEGILKLMDRRNVDFHSRKRGDRKKTIESRVKQ